MAELLSVKSLCGGGGWWGGFQCIAWSQPQSGLAVTKGQSEENNELFLLIMKMSDGGRFWKTIVVGDGDVTNQDRHDSWVAVAK